MLGVMGEDAFFARDDLHNIFPSTVQRDFFML